MKYTFSFFCILLYVTVSAQKVDSLTRKRDWKPSFILTGFDPARILAGSFSSTTTFEGFATVDFDTYLLTVEGGRAESYREDLFDYSSTGNFYRIGIAKNFSPLNREGNIFALGLSYARNSFEQTLAFSEVHPIFGEMNYNLTSSGAYARWLELNGMIQVKIWRQLYMGYAIRLKFMKKTFETGDIQPWDIPGFGRHKNNGSNVQSSNISLNYYLSWRFQLREKVSPKDIQKK